MDAFDKRKRFLKLAEAADALSVTPDFLAKEIRVGRLAAYRVGREWRLSPEQLEEWLRMIESRSKVA